MTQSGRIPANLASVRERIERAARRAGRRPEEVTLVGVSKTFPAECIREAHAAGVRHFGENRVQEWESKREHVADLGATWHLIGHLQSNKAARAARWFHSIDSVDDLAVARKLDRAASEASGACARKRLRLLIEVRLAEEVAKSGVREAELAALGEGIVTLPHLDLRGLMCLPPFFEYPERARPYFRRLCELRDLLEKRLGRGLPVLSMGMSHDFEAAIEEGATEVRVGTALFGMRGG